MSSDNDDEDIENVNGEIEQVFPGSFGFLGFPLFGPRSDIMRPLSRIEVGHDSVTVTFDIPGVSKEGISVTCTEDFVSMEAETRREFSGRIPGASGVEVSRYSERIRLPVPVDPDGGKAKYNNGILVVRLPRVHKGKAVKITSGRKGKE